MTRDLYMPRCLPDGEVVVASGQFLKPWIIVSWSIGCAIFSFGRVLDFRWHKRDLVYLLIGRQLMSGVLASTCWAYGLVQLSLTREWRGLIVKMEPLA